MKIFEKRRKEIFFVIMQILLLIFYFNLGKYDWEYLFDLPYRVVFTVLFNIIEIFFLGILVYFLGKKDNYKSDKILIAPIIFTILSIILLKFIDIIYVIKFCIYNGCFLFAVLNSKIELKSKLFNISKIMLWYIIMYFGIPAFIFIAQTIGIFVIILSPIIIITGIIILMIMREKRNMKKILLSLLLILIFSFGTFEIKYGIINVYFGYNIKKYYGRNERNIIKILLLLGCIVLYYIFTKAGFGLYKDDLYGIVYTFPYKEIMYSVEEENKSIIKTIYSQYFFYGIYTHFMFFIGLYAKKIVDMLFYKNKKERRF